MRIFFRYNERKPAIPGKALLKQLIEQQTTIHRKKLERITFIFCSDEYLLEINKQFLRHDYYTDIITFNLSDNPDVLWAEVYISVDRVRENATNLSNAFTDELLRVIFHGVLHLSGFGDKTKKQQMQMREMENVLIRKFKTKYKKLNPNGK
jgi:rRNA maturation RNase YbeY